ncbi:DUF1330 domain-containing protein [Ralstonia pseudosolanacearum]|uniref:DUF1330 domain-containing protein n=1 Tax=Ralstonia solanacearum TaxID=305 RepID=A0AA92K2L1_RALSL|nr:DUF1330 domain-containing protein [Ralstonia pseudosolanacearum]CBJ38375.1 conserved protein of unknown function, DUF1330 [Ralstonia solanacearum CMR15]QOK92169.1 DUF1330 domain-containing protein [Ralstonia pseudosolanacearum]QOK97149.1 DUF1330 domain-containing protein [Ralstonia pseudosolanacearum]UWD92339.1 DUF1330 domain-containing protein [Ralstonia pseudosolanacearum]CAH0439352.1 hypothetical protein LMG9673_00122 [Ralstonia pseudosolanacearum]
MSAGYILAYVDVTDPAQYEQYKVLSSRAMQAHGAEALVRGGKTEVLEGEWKPTRVVVLKFKSYDAAKAFYDSEEYRAARDARVKAARVNMIVVEGV